MIIYGCAVADLAGLFLRMFPECLPPESMREEVGRALQREDEAFKNLSRTIIEALKMRGYVIVKA